MQISQIPPLFTFNIGKMTSVKFSLEQKWHSMEKISIVLNIQNIKQNRIIRRAEEEEVRYNEFTCTVCLSRLLLQEHSSRQPHLQPVSSKGTRPELHFLENLIKLIWNYFTSS